MASLPELLRIEAIDDDLFGCQGAPAVREHLFGGLVAARALLAAGRTVDPDREPHSLHAYFLRAGDVTRPTLLRVVRDRDGRSFSARRVEVLQDDAVLLTMVTSFQRREDGVDYQADPMPTTSQPDRLPVVQLPEAVSLDCRIPDQPRPLGHLPTRFWARCTAALEPDPLLQASVLTYLSDLSNGLMALHKGSWRPSPTLSHTLWFHRPIRLDDWVLVDLVARNAGGGRGWYTGTVHARDGALGASLAQESRYGREQP